MKNLFYLLIPVAAIVNTAGQVFLKLGAENISLGEGVVGLIRSSWKLFVGLFFFGLTFLLTTIISRRLDVTFLYPIMTGLTFLLLSLVMAVVLRKEALSLFKVLGMFLIVFGIIVMTFTQKK